MIHMKQALIGMVLSFPLLILGSESARALSTTLTVTEGTYDVNFESIPLTTSNLQSSDTYGNSTLALDLANAYYSQNSTYLPNSFSNYTVGPIFVYGVSNNLVNLYADEVYQGYDYGVSFSSPAIYGQTYTVAIATQDVTSVPFDPNGGDIQVVIGTVIAMGILSKARKLG
jgi:hypothetical protein